MGIELGEPLKGGVDLRVRGRRAHGADRNGQGVLERRSQVGVLPGLEPPMRQAERRKGSDRRPARRRHAGAARQLSRGRLEVLGEPLLGLRPSYGHCHLTFTFFLDLSSTQAARLWNSAYPVFSSSSASSLPPDFWILPAAITCTRSGTM